MARRMVNWWTIVSLTLAGLALVRLGEVLVKRELAARVSGLTTELEDRRNEYQDSLNRRDALRVDQAAAQAQGKMGPDETYVWFRKMIARGQIMMGSKVVYEFRFRVRGGVPIQVKGQIPELPEGVLSAQAKEAHPAWFKPDWMYEQVRATVPTDSNERKVVDAFGSYAVFLGGGVAIHGPVSKLVPTEAVDHVYAELNEKDLKAVYNAVEEGTHVIIQR